jgi:hypothetical protein
LWKTLPDAGDSPNERIPLAQGMRLSWEEVPISVRKSIEEYLGRPVINSVTQFGGFSPGLAARLTLSDGRVVFAKAVGSKPNARSPDIHRKEARIASKLPQKVNAEYPRLLWFYDNGDWVSLLFENIEGIQPVLPWRHDELSKVLKAITTLSDSLTPSPIETITAGELFRTSFTAWREYATKESGVAENNDLSKFKVLDQWCLRNLDRLADLENRWEKAAKGNTLLHADIRADNILLRDDGGVVFVDWPWACTGARWMDLLFFLPSVAMQGGPKPWKIFDSHPLGMEAEYDGTSSVLAGLTGLFISLGNKLPEPGLPNLREFQLGQASTALEWLKVRTGWS